MKKLNILLLFLTLTATAAFSYTYDVSTYQLKNGLTVILNEDHSQTRVYGAVAVKAGGVNDPDDATGLAHYLEHVLFNGTTNVGTVNWDAEKVHYQKIIDLFEKLRETTDEAARNEIILEINKESIEQGKYFQTKEFVLLLESIGASGINAATSYDYTYFHSIFPPTQSAAWLEIYANEFKNPVFRNFQAELETVYEEFNMYAENPMQNFFNTTLRKMWEGSAYEKDIIGKSEHLKSPSLKKLIEFYETWYVPENMVLVLVGDFQTDKIKAEIESTFGQWEARSLSKEPMTEKVSLQKKATIRLKETPYNIGMWSYNAPYLSDQEVVKMQLLSEVLSNNAATGVLDQLQTDGDVMVIGTMYMPQKNASIFAIQAVPNFDLSQMRQLAPSEIDDLIFDKIEAIKKGKLDEASLNSVRDNYIRDFAVGMESFSSRGQMLVEYFISGREPADINHYFEELQNVKTSDVVEIANKYLNDVYLETTSSRGEIKLKEIEKPTIEPVLQTVEEPSEFARYMADKMSPPIENVQYIDFKSDIQRAELAEKVKFFYKQNTQNDIFNLTIKYKVGTAVIPTLDMAAQLMNNAGIRGNYEPHELKMKMGELGCSYYFSASDNYLTVAISGREKNLEEACKLISMITLMPDLDIKQVNSLKGMEMNSRNVQKFDFQNISAAASQYIVYGENSPYIDRLTWNELSQIDINSLTSDFMKASRYAASVHYVGNTPFEETKNRLLNSLAFASGRLDAPELYVRPIKKWEENTIFVINKSGTRQSNITLMVPAANPYSIEQDAAIDAYSKYFGEGLGNIFFQEIREFRSMAYSAGASVITPETQGKPTFMAGSVATQGDKTNNAVEIIFSLITEMPLKKNKAEGVKNNLVYSSILGRPRDRFLTQYIENLEMMGYTEDPNKFHQVNYSKANIDYINQYYQENIKGQPIAVVVVGDKKKIDTKALEKFGKYQYLNSDKLFKE
ncbi:MAG: insulinase family protein [Prolixibacteraceae bacterium]|nr:insulinase family protein [Prolixibacteraceae bacterium]